MCISPLASFHIATYSILRVCRKLGFFRVDPLRALPITTIRTGQGHDKGSDGRNFWCSCFSAFQTVHLAEMAHNSFATIVRMLEVPTDEELSLVDAVHGSSQQRAWWQHYIGDATPVAQRGVGYTATAAGHMPEGLLPLSLGRTTGTTEMTATEMTALMKEMSSRVSDARAILRVGLHLGQPPVRLASSTKLEVLADLWNGGAAKWDRCVAGARCSIATAHPSVSYHLGIDLHLPCMTHRFNIVATKEHTDAAAVLRTVMCHFDGVLVVLRRDEDHYDYEPVARQWLGRFDGGLNRLVSVQRSQGILPPSVSDAAPAVVKRSGAKKGSAHGVAKQPAASELESELSVGAGVGGGEGDDSEDERPLSSRRPTAALHGPPKPAALGRAATSNTMEVRSQRIGGVTTGVARTESAAAGAVRPGAGGSGQGQRGATERAAAPKAKSSESSESEDSDSESEELGPTEWTWGDEMLRNAEREHKKRRVFVTEERFVAPQLNSSDSDT